MQKWRFKIFSMKFSGHPENQSLHTEVPLHAYHIIPRTEVDCCETCLQSGEGAQKQTHHSPPFSSPFSQFWLGPLNVLLLKDQTYFYFEVFVALN